MPVETLSTRPPIPTTRLVTEDGRPSKQWFDFWATLWARTGGPNANINVLLDTLGTTRGAMLARFVDQWLAFVATVPNSIPILTPGADVDLKTISQLLDTLGAARGNILYRGAVGWTVLAPVLGGYLQSQGPGANPVYTLATTSVTVATGLTATGVDQGTALALAAQWNEVTVVAAGTGVVLNALGVGNDNRIWNVDAADDLNVYPPGGSEIDALGANSPYVLPFGKEQVFSQLTATAWRSTQLG